MKGKRYSTEEKVRILRNVDGGIALHGAPEYIRSDNGNLRGSG